MNRSCNRPCFLWHRRDWIFLEQQILKWKSRMGYGDPASCIVGVKAKCDASGVLCVKACSLEDDLKRFFRFSLFFKALWENALQNYLGYVSCVFKQHSAADHVFACLMENHFCNCLDLIDWRCNSVIGFACRHINTEIICKNCIKCQAHPCFETKWIVVPSERPFPHLIGFNTGQRRAVMSISAPLVFW